MVPSYRIEVFTASSTVSASGSKFGQSEVQTITTEDVAEGTFTLAFGPVEHALPGTVDIVAGEDFVITSEDLTPYVKRGDRVAFDGGLEYEVHAFMPFNASTLYLSQANWVNWEGFLIRNLGSVELDRASSMHSEVSYQKHIVYLCRCPMPFKAEKRSV